MSKIKLKKTLPTEVGLYYWCDNSDLNDIEIVEVERSHSEGRLFIDRLDYGTLRGYWAKVELDQFELVE